MKTNSLNPDIVLYEAAASVFQLKEFPEIEYRCDILQKNKQGDMSSPWAFSIARVFPKADAEEIAERLAAVVPNCYAEKGFLNFTFDLNALADRVEFLCGQFLLYLEECKKTVVPNDEASLFLPTYYLYRSAELRRNSVFAGSRADFTEESQKRVAGLTAWCDILYEKKQWEAFRSAVKILAEQVYFWDRSSREDFCHSNVFGAAGYIFSLCV